MNSKFRIISFFKYLKFLAKSTNQHGVHSPFVYNLVTQCFYDKEKYPEYKTIDRCIAKKEITSNQARLFFRLGSYFTFKNVLLVHDRGFGISKTLEISNPKIRFMDTSGYDRNQQKIDLIYLENIDFKTFKKEIERLFLQAHNDSLFLIQNIHRSKTAQKHWDYIKNHAKVKVTIDTFTYGFIFFRAEQAKEHFVIRL